MTSTSKYTFQLPKNRYRMSIYNHFIREMILIWASLIGVFTAGRLYFFFDFLPSGFFEKVSWGELLETFLLAARLDISVSTILLAPPFLLTLMGWWIIPNFQKIYYWLLQFWMAIALFFSVCLIELAHQYYYNFQDHFNVLFWEFWTNQENADLVLAGISDEVPIPKVVIGLLGLGLIGVFLNRFLKRIVPRFKITALQHPAWVVMWFFLFLLGVRATFERPLLIQYKYFKLSQPHLNFTNSNPMIALYSSWENDFLPVVARQQQMKSLRADKGGRLDFSKQNVKRDFEFYASLDELRSIKDYGPYWAMEYQVPGLRSQYLTKKPKHIVLLFMESFSDWVTRLEEDGFNQITASNLIELRKQSVSFEDYFPAGTVTMHNIMKAVLGIPGFSSGFPLEFTFPEVYKPFPYSLPKMMKKLGYVPRFFYGGSLKWHDMYYSLSRWGFEENFGEHHINSKDKPDFGAYDGDLFELLHEKLLEAQKPTFNMVMTLSNHAPFRVPDDFQVSQQLKIPKFLQDRLNNDQYFYKRFRTFAYSDFALGQYFEKAKKAPYFNETLFIITGDHPIHGGFRWKPEDKYRISKIPLLFYAPTLLKNPIAIKQERGTHLDLLPTLMSLLLDEPKTIHSWGRSLFYPSSQQYLNAFWIDCIKKMCFDHEETYQIETDQNLKFCQSALCNEESKALRQEIDAYARSGLHYFFNYEP
ncbi:sulfatase-like hydrolase/transferase [Deltaproteobacteria bacterium TL4]